MTLFYDRFDSPIGPLTIAADGAGLRHVLFASNRHDAKGREQWQHAPDAVAAFAAWVEARRRECVPYVAQRPWLVREVAEGLLLWLAFQL